MTAGVDGGQGGGTMGFRDRSNEDGITRRLLEGFVKVEEHGNVVEGITLPDPVEAVWRNILDSNHVESGSAPDRFKPSSKKRGGGVLGEDTVSRPRDQYTPRG